MSSYSWAIEGSALEGGEHRVGLPGRGQHVQRPSLAASWRTVGMVRFPGWEREFMARRGVRLSRFGSDWNAMLRHFYFALSA